MLEYFKLIYKLPRSVKFFIITEIFAGLGMGIWNLNLNFFLFSKGMLPDEIGRIVSAGSFATALFALPCGILYDRMGYKRSMVAGCILKVAAMLGTTLVGANGLLYLCRGLNGLGDCFMMVCVYPYITSLAEPRTRNTVYTLLFSTNMLSVFLGNVTSGLLASSIGSYRTAIMLGTMIVSLGAILRCFLPAAARNGAGNKFRIYIPRQGFVRIYFLYEFLGYIGYFFAYSMMNLICRNYFGLSDSMTGLVTGAMTLASGMAIFIIPVAAGRFDRLKINTAVMISLVAVYIVMIFARGGAFLILVIVTAAMQCMMAGLVDGPVLGRISDTEKGGFSGFRLLLSNMGTSAGVFGAGFVLKNLGDITALYIVVCILMASQLPLFVFGIQRHLSEGTEKPEKQPEGSGTRMSA